MAVINGDSLDNLLDGTSDSDTISGLGGSDTLNGGAGNDRLIGGTGADKLTGGAGNDVFVYDGREFGNDTIFDLQPGDKIDLQGVGVGDWASIAPFARQDGTDVVITLHHGFSDESIRVKNITVDALRDGNYFIFNTSSTVRDLVGTSGTDYLFGAGANDRLNGAGDGDVLVGGAGNDTLIGGTGADALYGGAGNDAFVYNDRQFGNDTIFDLKPGDKIDLQGIGVGDIASILPFMAQDGSDVVITLHHGFTDESIRIKDITVDALRTGNYFTFNTSATVRDLVGTSGTDYLFGAGANDRLNGAGDSDVLVGGAGNDILIGGTGGDRFFGGAGVDTVSYYGTNTGVTVNLLAGTGSGGDAQGDTFAGVENVNGSNVADTLTGNAGANQLQGYGGNDILQGGDGNDVLSGGVGADKLDGGAGIDTASYYNGTGGVTIDLGTGKGSGAEAQGDTLVGIENVSGSQGNDTLIGNAGANTLQGWNGNDVLRGGAGADRLDGGAGVDTVSYYTSSTGVSVNLTSGAGTGGEAQGDVLIGIENLSGSQGNDTLIGNAGANVLQGWNGNDVLRGGAGQDTLTGGAGADRFVYAATGDSVVGAGADRITDFSRPQADKIDLSLIDASTGTAGDQAFTFIGNGLFGHHAGELRFAVNGGAATIAGDVNGDGVSDFHIVLNGVTTLQASDFVL